MYPTRNGNILDLVFVTSLELVYDIKAVAHTGSQEIKIYMNID